MLPHALHTGHQFFHTHTHSVVDDSFNCEFSWLRRNSSSSQSS